MRGKANGVAAGTCKALPGLGLIGVLFGLGGGCLDVIGDVRVDDIDSEVFPNKAAGPDCTDAAAAAGSCVIRCEPNAPRCNDGLLQRCNERSDGWILVDQCASAALCDSNTVTCGAPACAAREHRCTETGELQVCNADRTGFDVVDQCRSAAFCSAVPGREGCEGTACRAGRQRCNGPQIEQCREDRSGFDRVGEPCASASLCREGESAAPYCEQPACEPGQFICQGATLARCSDDAVRFIPINECASPDACLAAEQRCAESACTPGAQRCTGAVLERCNAVGSAYELVEMCTRPELCVASASTCATAPGDVPDPSVLDGPEYDFTEAESDALLGLGPMELTVPREWTDVDRSPWVSSSGTTLGPRYVASSNAARFASNFDIPGVLFAATSVAPLEVAARLAEFDLSSRCTRGTSSTYEDELYIGTVQNWTGCGATGARTSVVVANDEDREFVTVVIVTMTASRDEEARERVWNSFVVND